MGGAVGLVAVLAVHARAAGPSLPASGLLPVPAPAGSPRVVEPFVDRPGAAGRPPPLGGAGAAVARRDRALAGEPIPRVPLPEPFGHTLRPGERFRFDVSFAGNPAGLARAEVVEVVQDAPFQPGAPAVHLRGHARTSGVVSLLAKVTDDLDTWLDPVTGAPLASRNVIHYDGLRLRYRHRVTDTDFYGRGALRIADRKDERATTKHMRVPRDTFDPLSAMAWVRSLRLSPGKGATAHVMDGLALLRVEVVSRGRQAPEELPPIARALGIAPSTIERIDGRLVRVDARDRPKPGARVYTLRAYLSTDARRLPLLMETDMWVGRLRLVLAQYDPPSG